MAVQETKKDVVEIKNAKGDVIYTHQGPSLHGACLGKAYLRDAQLQEMDLSEADLTDADLRESNLVGANLRGARLSEANFDGSDLSYADLRDTNINETSFKGATMIAVDLRGCTHAGWSSSADFTDAKMMRARLTGVDLSNADFIRADLRQADCSSTKLSMADFSFADLREAKLSDALFGNTKVEGAILYRTDLSVLRDHSEYIVPVKLYSASFDASTRWPMKPVLRRFRSLTRDEKLCGFTKSFWLALMAFCLSPFLFTAIGLSLSWIGILFVLYLVACFVWSGVKTWNRFNRTIAWEHDQFHGYILGMKSHGDQEPFSRSDWFQQIDTSRFRDVDLQHSRLDSLSLSEGFSWFESCSELDALDLGWTATSDDHLDSLAKIPKLSWINLQCTKVTDAGVEKLKEAHPRCEIIR